MTSRILTRCSMQARSFSISARRTKYELPKLPYEYNALEPSISGEIMQLHHQKHHQTYVNGLNAAEEQYSTALSSGDVKKQIALQAAIKFNGGGHLNHSLFWNNLAPHGSKETSLQKDSKLSQAITKQYGSFEEFKKTFNAACAGIQGSGWCWLGKKDNGQLEIVTTANQDPLISSKPVVGVDCWEHAFYLQYQNVKADYFKAIWDVINWQEAEQRFQA